MSVGEIIILAIVIVASAANVIFYIHNRLKVVEKIAGTLLITTDENDGSKYANLLFNDTYSKESAMNLPNGKYVTLIVKQQTVPWATRSSDTNS